MMFIRIAFAVVAMLLAQGARADEYYSFSRMLCSAQEDLAVVQFSQTNDQRTPQWLTVPEEIDHGLSARPSAKTTSACTFKSGAAIKLESRTEIGECLASDSGFFSLSVDGKPAFRNADFSGCSGLIIHSIVIERDLITLCRFGDEDPDGLKALTDRPVVCEAYAQAAYLLQWERVPPPAKQPEVGLWFAAIPEDTCWTIRRQFKAYKENGIELNRVDIDRDGRPENVLMNYSAGRGASSDSLYVLRDDANIDLIPIQQIYHPKHREELARQARYFIDGHGTLIRDEYAGFRLVNTYSQWYVSVTPSNRALAIAEVIYAGDPIQQWKTACVFAR